MKQYQYQSMPFFWSLHSCCATQGEGSHSAPSSPGYFLTAGHNQGWGWTRESHGIAGPLLREKADGFRIFLDKSLILLDPEPSFGAEASQ